MKLFRKRLTIRWLMAAVALASLLLVLYPKVFPRGPLYHSSFTDPVDNIAFRHSRLGLSPGGSWGSGEGDTSRGTKLRWVAWSDGSGHVEMLEYEDQPLRIYVGNKDYGPIARGDVVDFGLDEVRVNGSRRTPTIARPERKPRQWSGPNRAMPGEVIVHGPRTN